MIRLIPTTIKAANRFVAHVHRHNEPVQGGLFAVAVGDREDGKIGAVAIVGRPVAKSLDDGWTCEVLRLAADGEPNACSMLYAAAANAARHLGYQSIITYTLASELGTSLIAAGWEPEAEVRLQSWNRPSRHRYEINLFGEYIKPQEDKVRWRKWLVKSKKQRQPRVRTRGNSSR